MAGDNENAVKMCVKCNRLLPSDTIVCPDCGGILFETVNFDTGEEHNG